MIVGKSSDIQPKSGFTKINVDLNEGAGGKYIYLCYKAEQHADEKSYKDKEYISALEVVSGNSRNVDAPKGYKKIDVDLNMDAGGKYIYLCYQESNGAPVTDLNVLHTTDPNVKDQMPSSYTVCKTDVNEGAGGKYIYIYYKKG